ncbi:hypothetical protein GCM10023319_79930 [Nocardia iowensis]
MQSTRGNSVATVAREQAPLTAEVYGAERKQAGLGVAARPTGATFGSLVATPPKHPAIDLSALEPAPFEELLQTVREWVATPTENRGEPDRKLMACATYYQTYVWTGTTLDPWGADCD